MSRRRKKNPLLMRIILISVAAHAIILPIAAHYGAFDKLKKQFGEARVTLIPLPKAENEKPEPKEKKAKPKINKAKTSTTSAKRSGPAKADPNRQKVVAVNTPGGEGDGPSIQQGTKTDAGALPTDTKAAGTGKQSDAGVGPKVDTGPKTTTTTVTTPPPPPVSVPAETVKPKHIPVYVEPEQDYCPQPTIPDDLRVDSIDKDFIALFIVGSDGKPTDVKVVQSTGISELDDVALKTAKTWRFKPATLDGAGTESKVKLTIQFRVE